MPGIYAIKIGGIGERGGVDEQDEYEDEEEEGVTAVH